MPLGNTDTEQTLTAYLFKDSFFVLRGRGSPVSIVSCCGLDDWAIEVRYLAQARDFSSDLCVQTDSEAHPVSCTMGTGDPFPGGKTRLGPDAENSPPSSAEVVNE
jgi:hypothetical protein